MNNIGTKIITLLTFQTSVMHLVMETEANFWENSNLDVCLVKSLENLLCGFQQDSITDVFFPKVVAPQKLNSNTFMISSRSTFSTVSRIIS